MEIKVDTVFEKVIGFRASLHKQTVDMGVRKSSRARPDQGQGLPVGKRLRLAQKVSDVRARSNADAAEREAAGAKKVEAATKRRSIKNQKQKTKSKPVTHAKTKRSRA